MKWYSQNTSTGEDVKETAQSKSKSKRGGRRPGADYIELPMVTERARWARPSRKALEPNKQSSSAYPRYEASSKVRKWQDARHQPPYITPVPSGVHGAYNVLHRTHIQGDPTTSLWQRKQKLVQGSQSLISWTMYTSVAELHLGPCTPWYLLLAFGEVSKAGAATLPNTNRGS